MHRIALVEALEQFQPDVLKLHVPLTLQLLQLVLKRQLSDGTALAHQLYGGLSSLEVVHCHCGCSDLLEPVGLLVIHAER